MHIWPYTAKICLMADVVCVLENTSVNKTVYDIFPHPDERKFFSCMTLFAEVSAPGSEFQRALDLYFSGKKNKQTLRLLEQVEM